MRRLPALLFAIALPAAGQSCIPMDYQQAKDEAARPGGRITLRFEYCRLDRIRTTVYLQRDRDACDAAKSRIMTALQGAGDAQGVLWMVKKCEGEPPSSVLPAKPK